MTATGLIVAFCYLNVSVVVVNVIMNILLIPRYGAFGCCISALCSQFLLGIATMTFVHKKLNIVIDRRSLLLYLLNGLLLFAVIASLLKVSVSPWSLLVGAALITFVFMWATKMISLNKWFDLLKKQ